MRWTPLWFTSWGWKRITCMLAKSDNNMNKQVGGSWRGGFFFFSPRSWSLAQYVRLSPGNSDCFPLGQLSGFNAVLPSFDQTMYRRLISGIGRWVDDDERWKVAVAAHQSTEKKNLFIYLCCENLFIYLNFFFFFVLNFEISIIWFIDYLRIYLFTFKLRSQLGFLP